MKKLREGKLYTIFEGKEYCFLGKIKDQTHLKSLNETEYPSLILDNYDSNVLFEVNQWVTVRGCDAILLSCVKDKVKLYVKPSDDVRALKAIEVERGIYEAEVDKSEVKRLWEEFKPIIGFDFPSNLDKIQEIDLNDF